MAINNGNATTAGKNGTLGTQTAVASDEILFPSAITTNNGNLEPAPTFRGRGVILRRDETPTKATAVLTLTSNPLNTETVVIDGKTYTFRTTITNTNNGDVLIAGTAEASMENLIASINLDDGNGFNYSDDTTLHATYSALKTTATTMTVTAKTHGIGANGDVMTETIVTGGSWGGNATGGLDGEETAVLIAQVSGNRWSLHQDWVNPAQSGNTYDVSYVLRDFSGNGASLIGKRQDDWSFNQILNVGNGTAFAYVGIFEGSSMETLDNGSTTVADVRVRTNARLDAGVIFGTFEDGTPVSSGYIINTAGGGSGTDGRMGIDLDAGADTHFNGFFHTSVQQTLHDMQGTGAGIHKWKDFKVFKGMRSTRWLDNVDIVDGLFEGFSNTLDTITLSANIGNFNGSLHSESILPSPLPPVDPA